MKRETMNKILVMLLSVAMLVTLAGCGNSAKNDSQGIILEGQGSEEKEQVEITFLGFKADPMNLTVIEATLHGYMEQNESVLVYYEGIKGSPYWEVFELRAEQNRMDDVMMVDHDRMIKLRDEGKLADLSELSTISGFNEMAKCQFIEEDGSVYFLPTNISTYGIYINYNLLKAHNIPVPTNYAEFTDACDYFVSQGIVPIIGNNYSTLRTLMSAKSLYPVYQMDKPEEMIEKFNSGEVDIMDYLSAGVELVGEMLDKGWFDKEELKNTAQTSDDLMLFAAGDRPFLITGGWASQRLTSMEPDFEYGIHPFPILPEGSVLVMDVNTCISVAANSDALEIAKNFVEYLTQPDVIFAYCDGQSCYTPLADNRVPSDKTIAPSAPYLFNGQSIIGSDYRLNLPLDNAEKEVGEAMLDGMSTQDAIAKLAELMK